MTVWVCVIDVGSYKNLGWALRSGDGEVVRSTTIEGLLDRLPTILGSSGLALGLEAPMYFPRNRDLSRFTQARAIDGRHPWSARAGATVATIGLALLTNVLERLREAAPMAEATLDPIATPRPNLLHIFEAFIGGRRVRPTGENPHHLDADLAARAYLAPDTRQIAVAPEQSFSLAGARCLRLNGVRTCASCTRPAS